MSVSLIDLTDPKIGNEVSLTTNYRSIPQHSLLSQSITMGLIHPFHSSDNNRLFSLILILFP